jgi:hypothetical protein
MTPETNQYPVEIPFKDRTQVAVTLRHGKRQFSIVVYAMTPPREGFIHADIIMSTTVEQRHLGESVVKFSLLLYKDADKRTIHRYFTQQPTQNEAASVDSANIMQEIAELWLPTVVYLETLTD